MRKLFTPLLLCTLPVGEVMADDHKAEAIDIVDEIVSVCQKDGMSACAPYIHGIDRIFLYATVFDRLEEIEIAFDNFLKERYATERNDIVDFDLLQADVELSLDVTFKTGQFSGRVQNVDAVENGFDMEMDTGSIITLRQVQGEWHIKMPTELDGQVRQIEPFFLAAQLKRSILQYRALEAQLLDLSQDELEERVSADLAPVYLAIFSEQEVPAAIKWLVKDVESVVAFYRQFSGASEMRDYIVRENKL